MVAAGFDAGGLGLFTGDGTTNTTIADDTGPLDGFPNPSSTNNSGTVAVTAQFDDGTVEYFPINLVFVVPSLYDKQVRCFIGDLV